jgi:drug/metabolite transporter (DMT)-like permease
VEEETRKRIALPAVLVGVLAVGASAVFIRLADAPALAIAFWRCALGALALVPLAAYNREVVPKGSALWVGAVSGGALGAHFGTWITSLEYTSVAASVVLVSTTPVFVAIAAYPLFGERTSAVSFVGIVVAIAGTAVIALGEPSSGGSAFFGDVLALVGGRGYGGLRPDRSLAENRGHGGAVLLDRRLLGGWAGAVARGAGLRRPVVGLSRLDMVLAARDNARAAAFGPHGPQLGLGVRKGSNHLGVHTRRAGHRRAVGVGGPLREAGDVDRGGGRRGARGALPAT